MSPDNIYTRNDKKLRGVFYTPPFLADYLANKVLKYYGTDKHVSSIIDPACGDSILLQSISKGYLRNRTDHLPKLIGIDNDINAIVSSKSIFNQKPNKQFPTTFIHTDGLFPLNNINSSKGWDELRKYLKLDNGFNISVSNPPWGADLNGYSNFQLSSNFSLAKGQFDVFDLFTEIVLRNLNVNGVYGFILPDSVFSHEQSGFRRLLSTTTTIHLIARLGEKLFPGINRACVIIVGRKALPKKDHRVDCFRLSSTFKKQVVLNELTLENVEQSLSHKVLQSRFSDNENYLFDIDLKSGEQNILETIRLNSTPLKTYVTNTRGAEISKKGIISQCPSCKLWMPFPKSEKPKCIHCGSSLDINVVLKEKIILNHNGIGNYKLKVGEDLYRFTSFTKSWINTSKKGVNYKDLNMYKGDKILVRKTGVGITASIDYDNSVTNQVVYILKLQHIYSKCLTLEFILAVLNSRAMTYYLIKMYGENEWKSHPYLTQSMLVNLPFPKIDFHSKLSLQKMRRVTQIVKSEVIHSKEVNISKKNDLRIERIVASFFNLKKNDYDAIFKTLSSSEQLIPIKRLLNCNTKEIFKTNGL